MRLSVQITRGIESLFGTRDENIRVLEKGLGRHRQSDERCLEIEGEEPNVIRAASILEDYVALVKEGQQFANGDLNSYLRVVTEDPEVTLRSLVHSGRQRNFGKKTLAPEDHQSAPLPGGHRAPRSGVRHRARRHRQDLSRRGDGRFRADE